MKKIIFSTILMLFAAKSCFYVDDSEYYVDISYEYNPEVSISSNFDTIDSIRIVDSLLFRYEISIDTGTLFFADLFLDNLQLYRSGELIDSIWFYPNYINDAEFYDVSVVAYYRTHSGSLADIMDAEFYIADTSWTVQFFKTLE